MVGIAKTEVDTALVAIVRREVERYAGNAYQARLYPVLDDSNQTYAVIIIEDDPTARPAWVVVMAQVDGDKIVIHEDTSLDKPLYEALMVNGGIPREQIILAYAGETVPTDSADQ